MNLLSNVVIKGIGGYVPEKRVTNKDMSKIVDTSHEWIVTRTGIEERRQVQGNEGCADLAYKAVINLKENGYNIDDTDLIIVATMSPDHYTPSVSAQLQGRLNLREETLVMDINAACAGFVQAIQIANGLISSGQNSKALIVGVEVLSKITDYTDRATCVLFGDGAGAVIMEKSKNKGIYAINYGSVGNMGHKLFCSNLNNYISNNYIEENKQKKLVQDGRAVYNFAIKTVPKGVKDLLKKGNFSLDDLNWFIPHSANLRMIQFIAKELNIPMDSVLESVTKFGNTSAASIPLALWRGYNQDLLKDGDLIITYGFGGGLNYAGALFRWYK